MKKIAKLSLVAAVAITGLTTTASAMEGVKTSGKVYVEAIADTPKSGATTSTYDIDFDLKAVKTISDNLSATVQVQADRQTTDRTATANTGVTMDQVYFTYKNGGATAMYGQQPINTPTTDGDRGTGAVVTYAVADNITVAGAYFGQNALGASFTGATATLVTNSKTTAVALLGAAGPVNFQLWNVSLSQVASNNTLVVGGKFGMVNAEARLATTSWETTGTKDGQSMKLKLGVDLDAVALRATYFSTNKDGAALVTDASSANTFELSQLGLKNSADATLVHAGVTVPAGPVKVLLDYATAEIKTAAVGDDENRTETRARVMGSVAKATSMMVTYSMADINGAENKSARVEIKHSF